MTIMYEETTRRLVVDQLDFLEQRDLLLRSQPFNPDKYEGWYGKEGEILVTTKLDYQGFDFTLYQQPDSDFFAVRLIPARFFFEFQRAPGTLKDRMAILFLQGTPDSFPSRYWNSREWLEACIECQKISLHGIIF